MILTIALTAAMLQPVPRQPGATRPASPAYERDVSGWCVTPEQRRKLPLSQQVLAPSCHMGANPAPLKPKD